MKKILTKGFDILLVAAILWLVISFFDIISQNTIPNPQYNDYNLFVILMELSGNKI